MRKWVALGLGVAFVALVAVFLFTPPEGPRPVDAPAPVAAPPSPGAAAPVLSSPSGRVVRAADRSAVAGAEVFAFQLDDHPLPRCPLCRRGVRWCTDVDSIKTMLRLIRAGGLARTPLARTVTGADGTFTFPPLPEGVEVVVRTAEGFATPGDDPHADIELDAQHLPALRVLDEQGAPLAGLELIVFTDLDGQHRTVKSDAAGRVPLVLTDLGGWLGTDAPGFVPTALFMIDEETDVLTLSRPKALLIKTVQGGRPFDADVFVAQRGHERKVTTRGGEVRVEGLSSEPVELRASTRELNSELVTLSPTAPSTEVVLTLESNAVLALTVEGDRTRRMTMAVLQARGPRQPVVSAHVRAGTTTTLGPVEVGSYELDLREVGKASVHRLLDLHAGRNELTVSLSGGLEVRGVVVDDLDHPLPDVQVKLADEPDQAVFTTATGQFALGLEKPGRVTLVASALEVGETRQDVEGPATDLRLVIARPAQLVLEVRTLDHKPVSGTVFLTQDERVTNHLTFQDELVSKPFRLPAGHYRLEGHFDGRPARQLDFDVRVAEERRLVLDLAGGAEVSGRLLTRAGSGVPGATILALCDQESFADFHTDAEGRFKLEGLTAGPCTLMVSTSFTEDLQDFEVKAPSRDLELTLSSAGRAVRGRVVDEQGQPLDGLRCDQKRVPTEAGRFALFTEASTLELEVDRYAPVTVAVTKEDLGDVTLRALPACTGVVVSSEGTPVGGAELSMGWPELGRAFRFGESEKDGTFRVELKDDQPTPVNANKQARAGSAQCTPGAKVKIVLGSEVRVDGVVFEAPGRGGSARVTAISARVAGPREASTDGSGRFSLSLAEGLWLISTRPGVVTRTWAVQGPSLNLGLGAAPDTCSLTVRAAEPFATFWLLPAQAQSPEQFATTPGAARVLLPQPVRSATVAGLPCGALQLMTGATRQPVLLAPPLTEVLLTPPGGSP